MSASRKTENFNLPLYNADDATSWLVDFNGAMTELETHLTEMRNKLTTDGEDLDNLEKAVANLNKTTSQLTDSVIKVQESGKSNSSAITLLQTHDNEQDTRIDNLNGEIDGLRGTYEKYENITIGNISNDIFTLSNVKLKIGKTSIGNATKYDAYLYFMFDISRDYEIKKGIHFTLNDIPHLTEVMANSELETMNISAWGYNGNASPLEIDSLLGARFGGITLKFNGDNADGVVTLPETVGNYVCIKISGLLEG